MKVAIALGSANAPHNSAGNQLSNRVAAAQKRSNDIGISSG